MSRSTTPISRRTFALGSASVVAAPIFTTMARAADASITYAGWGGSVQDLLVEQVINPFTKETGIQVKIANGPELAKVKAMQMTGNIEWDVFDSAGTVLAVGSRMGLWEPLDRALFDVADLAVPLPSDHVAAYIYGGGIAWDPKKFAEGKAPTTFAEYFDLKKFPGRRTLRNRPGETLELALLADGVAPKGIYPLDVDRAFKALNRIKPNVVWVSATPQTISLVQSGEVDYTYAYAGRVKATHGAKTPLAFSTKQNVFDISGYAIPKGSKNKANAMKFLAYATRADVQARWLEKHGSNPVSKKAATMLSPEAQKFFPNPANPNSVLLNDKWWADHGDDVTRRFNEWILT